MVLLLILFTIVLLAVLAPRHGVDSRGLAPGSGSPPEEDKLWSRQP